jgi:hypothetical protein
MFDFKPFWRIEDYREYMRKKEISDAKELAEIRAKGLFSQLVYKHFGCSGPITKSQKEKYLSLGLYDPRKGNNMNEITNTDTEVPFNLDMVEILDADGNPTGQYKARDGEAASAKTTFITTEDGDHEVTVH